MQMCACLNVSEHMGEVIDCVLRSLHGFGPAALMSESPRLQQTKHAKSAKPRSVGTGLCFKFSDTNVVFQAIILLILVVRNEKRSSGIDGKTNDFFSRNCLYCRYPELRFC